MSLAFPLEESERSPQVSERIQTLNKIQAQCEQKLASIKKYEQFLLGKLDSVQNRLNEFAQKQLSTIHNQLKELEAQRMRERSYMISSINKLSEFTCIAEAQSFLKDQIAPLLLERVLPVKEQEKVQIQQTINRIVSVDLTYEAPIVAEPDEVLTQLNLKEKFQPYKLRLSEEDIVSGIPELPEKIKL